MTYIMISFNFFTTRASHPWNTKHMISNINHQPLFHFLKSCDFYLSIKCVCVCVPPDTDQPAGSVFQYSYWCRADSSWLARCCFWILWTSVYSSSQSSCEFHSSEAKSGQHRHWVQWVKIPGCCKLNTPHNCEQRDLKSCSRLVPKLETIKDEISNC